MNLRYDGNDLLRTIKSAPYFPYKTGVLRDDTWGDMISNSTYKIEFNHKGQSPYVQYLEEGTKPHDIPNAFGLGDKRRNPYTHEFPFGVGGRFDGFFHPGSTKHYHFIQDKVIDTILMYFVVKYNGEVRL